MGNQGRRYRRAEERRRLKELKQAGILDQLAAVADFAGHDPAGESSAGRFVPVGTGGADSPPASGVVGTTVVASFATTGDVAGIFRVHPKTIERWRKRHKLPCVIVGGSVRYDLSDVLRWASARKEGV